LPLRGHQDVDVAKNGVSRRFDIVKQPSTLWRIVKRGCSFGELVRSDSQRGAFQAMCRRGSRRATCSPKSLQQRRQFRPEHDKHLVSNAWIAKGLLIKLASVNGVWRSAGQGSRSIFFRRSLRGKCSHLVNDGFKIINEMFARMPATRLENPLARCASSGRNPVWFV
jgi:hypothetical protein